MFSGPTVRLGVAVIAAFAVLLLAGSAAASPPTGAMRQIASPNDCIEQDLGGDCGTTSGLGVEGADGVAVSPDGKNVYVAGFSSNAVAAFTRNPDGSLTQLASPNGCFEETGGDWLGVVECPRTGTLGLRAATAVVVTPDGQNVYVVGVTGSSTGAIAEFSRDATTGVLTPLGCVQERATGGECATAVRGIGDGVGIWASPDSQNIYIAAQGGQGSTANGDVAVLTRSSDGTLSQPASPNDCIEEAPSTGECGSAGKGLNAAESVTGSPNGANVYVGSSSAVASFTRNGDGSLTQLGGAAACAAEGVSPAACPTGGSGLNGTIIGLAVSPDGANLYTIAESTTGPVAEFSRNGSDGSLSELGCLSEGGGECAATGGHGLKFPFGIAISGDGANVFVAGSSSRAVAELARNPDGMLAQLASPDDCIQEHGGATVDCGTTTGTGLTDPLGITLSPDGANAYAVSGPLGGGAVVALARTVAAVSATGSTVAASPVSVAADGTTTSTLTVTLKDGSGNPVAGKTVTLGAGGGSSTISGSSGSSSASGVVTFTVKDGTAESVTYTARDTTDSVTVTQTATVTFAAVASAPPPPAAPVNESPIVAFTVSPGSPVAGGTAAFAGSASDADGDAIIAYTWSFGDGATAVGAVTTHTYGNPGTYTVTLTARDAAGLSGTSTRALVVGARSPSVSILVQPSHPPVDRPATFTAVVGSAPGQLPAASIVWSFGDGGTALGAVVSHVYLKAARFVARVTVTDTAGASAASTVEVRVLSAPGVSFTVAPVPVAAQIDETLAGAVVPRAGLAGATRVVRWQWSFGDGTEAVGQRVQHTFASEGSYVVRLTVTDESGVSGSATQTISVGPPGIAVTVTAGATVTDTVAAPVHVTITAGATVTDTTSTPVHVTITAGATVADTVLPPMQVVITGGATVGDAVTSPKRPLRLDGHVIRRPIASGTSPSRGKK